MNAFRRAMDEPPTPGSESDPLLPVLHRNVRRKLEDVDHSQPPALAVLLAFKERLAEAFPPSEAARGTSDPARLPEPLLEFYSEGRRVLGPYRLPGPYVVLQCEVRRGLRALFRTCPDSLRSDRLEPEARGVTPLEWT